MTSQRPSSSPRGAWPPDRPALSGTPTASALELSSDEHVQTGIWECTAGRFASRRDGCSELMHFVAGEGTITDADGTVHQVGPGALIYVPDGWRGTWNITRTVRKSYTIVAST
jgi:uncharacterized cupin superfamily protein